MLSEPASPEQFGAAMTAVATLAGAEAFFVARLHGAGLEEVVHLMHDGGEAARSRFDPPHWSVERMLDAMRRTRVPLAFGTPELPGIDVDRFRCGVGAVSRVGDGACVVYLGLREPVATQDQLFTLMSLAQLAAQHAAVGLKGKAPRACPMTKQELACLNYAVAGLTAKQTAREMGISARTVESHLDRARMRCGVDSTLALSALAFKEGWVDRPDVRAAGIAN